MADSKINNMTIGKTKSSQKEMASIYFKIIGILKDITLTPMELNVLVHTALNGTITSPPVRESFIEEHKSSNASLNNYISKLQEKELLTKDERLKIRINPKFMKTFDKDEYNLTLKFKIL